MQWQLPCLLLKLQNSKRRPQMELNIQSTEAGAEEVLTHLWETNARHSFLADKTAKEIKIEPGASYSRNQSNRGMWHCRAAYCLSQTTGCETFDLGVHLQMLITLQLQPAEHLDKEYASAGTANTSFQPPAAKQCYFSTPEGRLASLQAAERFGCLFSTRKAVKTLSESRTHTEMLQQTTWMAILAANSTGLLLATCVIYGIWFQLLLQGMTFLAGPEHQPPSRKNDTATRGHTFHPPPSRQQAKRQLIAYRFSDPKLNICLLSTKPRITFILPLLLREALAVHLPVLA